MNFAFEIWRESNPSHVMGTFGTNRIYSVGRMVKVADRMRLGFAPARVRFHGKLALTVTGLSHVHILTRPQKSF